MTPKSPSVIHPFPIEDIARRSNIWRYLLLRWLGARIDLLVLFLFLALPDFALGNPLYQRTIWIWVVGPILYFPILEGIWGRTLGKVVAGITVVDNCGHAPGILKALLRTVTRFVEVNPLAAGGLPAAIAVLMSQRRQRLGDMLAKTYVVRIKDLTPTPQASNESGTQK